jgi:hypothetical protein
VAFADTPDLHTAAHEAAHVVQQRSGVHLKAGVGEVGDSYERNADAVADRVVAGDSAQDLLDQHASVGGVVGSSAFAPVQAKLRFDGALAWLNAQVNPALASRFSTLAGVMYEADTLSGGVDVDVVAEKPQLGVASYSFDRQKVSISPMPVGSEQAIESLSGHEVNDRVISMSHELRHVCDAFQRQDTALRGAVRKHEPWEELIHSEWRAHATQAKAAFEIAGTQSVKEVPYQHKDLMNRWKTNTFDISQAGKAQSMFENTRSYIRQYGPSKDSPPNDKVETFIQVHQNWVAEAFAICPPRDTGGLP